jgi:MFS family permease
MTNPSMDGTEEPRMSFAFKLSLIAFPIVTAYAQIALLPALPTLAKVFVDAPYRDALVRLLVTAVGMAMVVGAPFAGMIAKRLGWRRTIIGAIIVFALAGVSGAVLGNLVAMVISRMVVGVSVAILGALLISLLTLRLEGGERDRWLGYVVLAGTLGSIVIIPLSGLLASIDWRLPFALHLAGLVALLAVIPGVTEPDMVEQSDAGHAEVAPSRFPFWALGTGLLVGVMVHAQSSFIPFHLSEIGVADPKLISMAMVAGIPIGAVGSFAYGRLRSAVSIRTMFYATSIISAAGFFLVGIADSLAMVIAGNLLLGGAAGMLTPNMFAFAASRSNAEHRARDIGVLRGAFSAGPFMGQMALEPVARFGDAGMAVLALCPVALAALIVFRLVVRQELSAASD